MKRLLFLFLILALITLACKVEKISTPFPVTPTINVTATVTPTPSCTPESPPTATIVKVNVERGLNLRKESTTNSESLAVIPPNSEVEIIGEVDQFGWVCVKYGDFIGYVNSDFLFLP